MMLATNIIYNVLYISISDPEKRNIYDHFVPSYYPLVNDENYNSDSSYMIEIFSPSNTTSNLKLETVYLVIDTDN